MSATSASSPKRTYPFAGYLAIFILLVAGLIAYSGSLQGPFFFDDASSILQNPTIRDLKSLGKVFAPPTAGEAVQNRPIVNLTLAVNYALGGYQVFGYHALNLVIHLLAGLTLFGLVRRSIQMTDWELPPTATAFGISLLWLLHPLNTEAVTYVIQRTESLMGLFLLGTLYASVRAREVSSAARAWKGCAVLFCALGMGCKESMVVAPLLAFLHDLSFSRTKLTDLIRERRELYVGLSATWLILLSLLVTASGSRDQAAGFGHGMSAWHYFLTQWEAIPHYLRLGFWPHPLIADYGIPLQKSLLNVIPQGLLLFTLGGLTLLALRRRHALGFLGAWFFLLLAPSSSVVPLVTQTMAEKRMYLPLAALIALVVVLAIRLWHRLAWNTWVLGCLLAAVAVALGTRTYLRNRDYQDDLGMWQQIAKHRPANTRAFGNIGSLLVQRNRPQEALAFLDRALQLSPSHWSARANRGLALTQLGRYRQALDDFNLAINKDPNPPQPYNNRGLLWAKVGRLDFAILDFTQAIDRDSQQPEYFSNRALALAKVGEIALARRDVQRLQRLGAQPGPVLLKALGE